LPTSVCLMYRPIILIVTRVTTRVLLIAIFFVLQASGQSGVVSSPQSRAQSEERSVSGRQPASSIPVVIPCDCDDSDDSDDDDGGGGGDGSGDDDDDDDDDGEGDDNDNPCDLITSDVCVVGTPTPATPAPTPEPDPTFDQPPAPTPGPTLRPPTPKPTTVPTPPGAKVGCANAGSNSVRANLLANMANTAENAINATLSGSIGSNVEWAGFIYESNANDSLSYTSASYTLSSSGIASGFPESPPAVSGYTAIAYWHTHPLDYADTDDPSGYDESPSTTMPYTNTMFTAADEDYANSNDIYGFVGIENNAGLVWGEWQPGGTIGQITNFTNKGGVQKGC